MNRRKVKRVTVPGVVTSTKIATDLFEARTGQKVIRKRPIRDEDGKILGYVSGTEKDRPSPAARKQEARKARKAPRSPDPATVEMIENSEIIGSEDPPRFGLDAEGVIVTDNDTDPEDGEEGEDE